MKIAILSDIHDHIGNLEKIAQQIKAKVEAIIFLGDMCAPFTAGAMGQIGLPIYACLGNVDEDHIAMLQRGGDNFTWTPLTKEFGEVELDKKKIAFCHYPKLGELLAKTGDYDAVFFGHTHQVVNKKIGQSLLVNPGAVCGIVPGKGYVRATYAIYDTKTNSAQIVEIT
ncbi:MAG: phosphodiesterase, MJ0936 family protein [Candidatus Beckwithbacteria bacterium GW2011_GWB1_47_15]|uniref:Phosphoesterase n=1 Tax=Candidatus Beckwithbacteria bacterium GW2011_GWB1_47_15 TaxID=1618371 RepID=A0A0G1U6U3_9BACT|nr:MAG: phosphodiesterase [Candidatus Beckwithbacteria bacterium GW2011_GWC1_49_16]AQS30779.1 hypothetical protein [uncultured bacterium]KKU35964.1 MAG: phosphodiesterase, MJ0936 family protein [Candidatus Beckwithbacteria bacterium GW2011_GWA1_46_30]KKU61928.1 MAG: phosphodiesterase, MJ0936 family protein [Candidatus Beckwithbacteria bacterium GW2011_GWB1_47_15]KKU72518.1 MAG: phosphodiesterase, MJ0936 family protein [Candidatus Beckwithbacteria bacterium GW2011_GWA2_47_25]KKW04315.1 MAG: pho